jgi:hypothetical protein
MNIAFPAIILFLLILPGIFFRYAYNRGSWRSPFRISTAQHAIFTSLFATIIIHFLFILVIPLIPFPYKIDYGSVIILLAGFDFGTSEEFSAAIKSVANYPLSITMYFIVSSSTGYVLGRLSHFLIRKFKLDLSIDLFKFDNDYYYLLNGEAIVFDDNKFVQIQEDLGFEKPMTAKSIGLFKKRRKTIESVLKNIDLTLISALVNISEDTFIYVGVLDDFFFDDTGLLDTIVLTDVYRRSIDRDDSDNARKSVNFDAFYSIKGTYLLLDFDTVINLNIDYIRNLEED